MKTADRKLLNKVKKAEVLKQQIAHLSGELDPLLDEIKGYLGDDTMLVSQGGAELVTYEHRSQRKFDIKTFRKEHPEEADEYAYVCEYRALKFCRV